MICCICELSTRKHHHAKITLKIDTCFGVPYSLCSHKWPFMGHVMISRGYRKHVLYGDSTADGGMT